LGFEEGGGGGGMEEGPVEGSEGMRYVGEGEWESVRSGCL